MEGMCVQFFILEGVKHAHQPIHEWLFDVARGLEIPGGTVLRAAAGYGRHGLHEDVFFELAGHLPETIEFFAAADKINALIARVSAAGLRLAYIQFPVRCGIT